MDRPGRDREGAGTAHHRGADRGAEGPSADDINYEVAQAREKEVRHDVMSHVYAYGVPVPQGKGHHPSGSHLLLRGRQHRHHHHGRGAEAGAARSWSMSSHELANFADKYKALPTLAFTHFQPAQPTTVGKRATLWLQGVYDWIWRILEYVLGSHEAAWAPREPPAPRQASWSCLTAIEEKIDKIDPMIAEKMGFNACYPVSGQTYSRKVDTRVLNVLAGIAASAHKMSNDIRLSAASERGGRAL